MCDEALPAQRLCTGSLLRQRSDRSSIDPDNDNKEVMRRGVVTVCRAELCSRGNEVSESKRGPAGLENQLGGDNQAQILSRSTPNSDKKCSAVVFACSAGFLEPRLLDCLSLRCRRSLLRPTGSGLPCYAEPETIAGRGSGEESTTSEQIDGRAVKPLAASLGSMPAPPVVVAGLDGVKIAIWLP